MQIKRIIFVARSGTCREPMAAGIFKDCMPYSQIEVLARGLVVSFSEPMNQKAEAVLIGNGIDMSGFTSVELSDEDITEDTLIFTMEKGQREKVIARYENATEQNTFVLTEYAGDELEILDPIGGELNVYGLCYETLRKSVKKLIKKLNENEKE